MPPLMMTGVNATASSPSSTLRRVTSKKFPSVKKFCAIAENSATSASSAMQQDPLAVRKPALAPLNGGHDVPTATTGA